MVGMSLTEIHIWVLLYEVTLRVASWPSNLEVTLIYAICHLKPQTLNSSSINESIYYRYMHLENVNKHSASEFI